MAFIEVLLGIILIAAGFVLFCIWYDTNHFHKVYYRLSSDKISKPVKFVVLADLHDTEYGKDHCDLLKAIHEEAPDAILTAGDILTARPTEYGGYHDTALRLMERLCETYPVYYGMGNHEAKMGWSRKNFGDQQISYLEAVKETGAVLLRNQNVRLDKQPIRIYGLDMEFKYYERCKDVSLPDDYLQSKFGTGDESNYNIVLAHNPAYFDQYALWKPDLVLSGHVHGGLIRLPFLGGVISPALKLFPKYDGGMFIAEHTGAEHENRVHCRKHKSGKSNKIMGLQNASVTSAMILSRGLGSHSIGFRLWNPGELIVITIEPAQKKD